MMALGLGPGISSVSRAVAGDFYALYVAMGAADLMSAVLMYVAKPPNRPDRNGANNVTLVY